MKTKTILSQVAARTAHGARLATLLLAAVAAGRAWAIVADDVWELESGLPTSGTQEGANGNYTLTAADDSTLGATIDLSGVSSLANVSVLVKYTGLSAQSSGYYTLASVQAAASSSSSNVIGWRNSAENALTATGYYVASPLNAYRFDTYSVSNYTYSEGTVPELPESGYFLFTHDISASDYSGTYGTALYAASSLSSLAGGVNRQLKWARDTNSARCITTLSVGGPVAVSSTEAAAVSAWPNVTIEKVALFVGQTLTPSDVASYQFPSEQDYAATITTDTGWDDITWTKDWVESSDATITVESDATLAIPDTIEIGTLNLVIASGVTLTLANSGTITAISSAGGTLKFTGTAIIPALSGSSTLAIDAGATLTAGGVLAHAGGTTMGSGAKLNTTAAYGFGTGAFTSDDTTAEVTYVGGGTGTTTLSSAATQFGASTWTGSVVIPSFTATATTAIHFNYLGNTGSTVVLKGIPNSSYSVYPAEYGKTINPTLQIDGNVYFTDGTSSGVTTFSTVTGSGGFYFSTKNWHINTVTNFTGSLGARQADGCYLSIGTIALASDTTVSVGNKLVKIDKAWTNITDYASTVVTIGGTATALKVAKNGTYANNDVGLYVAGVAVEVDGGATVTVPATWLETYGLTSATASDLTADLTADRSAGNGYSYFACYALGLDPTDADSVPLATITSDSDGNFVVGLTGCGTIPDNVSITLSLVSTTDIDDDFAACTPTSTSGSGIDTTFTITPSTESSVEFFKVKITIGSAE